MIEGRPAGGLLLRSINFSPVRGRGILQSPYLLIVPFGTAIGAVTGFRIVALVSVTGNSAFAQDAPALRLGLFCLQSWHGCLAGA